MTRGKRSQASPERTESERERDRAERERHRAERAAGQRGQDAAAAALGANGLAKKPADGPSVPEGPDAPEAPGDGSDGGQPPTGDGAPAELDAGPEVTAQLEPASAERAQGPVPPTPTTLQPTGGEVDGGDAAAARLPLAPATPASAPASTPDPSIAGRRAGPAVRPPGRRSPVARMLALLALAAVVAAVVLLVKSLSGSSQAKKTLVPGVVKVVIPEGATRLQIAHIAAADGLTGSYRRASKRSPLLDPARYEAPSGTRDLEGFLFPASYDMYAGAPVSRLVQEQLIAFRENFGPTETARARALHVTPYQLLTIASMVEREAKVPGDRAKIAAVIYNRLKRAMPLGIDATIYYALEQERGIPTYTKELTEAQLQLNSPYNTRTHVGLPPTPISNPGLASIEAAGHPARVAYLYYVLAADGCGEHSFSTTLAKFEADAAAYRAAVGKNGGAPPSCKSK
ncbi:MAG TPA: endolytic transglycosylase MltG [Solirubrobacteraceae bacterium]|nr:endolytic transglycosylase MltG [Solirubrobacteraceae bacterium]